MSTDSQVDATTPSLSDSSSTSPTAIEPVGVSGAKQTRHRKVVVFVMTCIHGWTRSRIITRFLVWVVLGTQIAWFGLGNAQLSIADDPHISDIYYLAFSAGLVGVWMGALPRNGSRSPRVFDTRPTEFIRVADSSFRQSAIIAFLTKIHVACGFLLIRLWVGVAVLLVAGRPWRQWLVFKRENGQYSARVLLVGSEVSVARAVHELHRSPSADYHIVDAYVPSGRIARTITRTRIPTTGNVNAVDGAVAVTSTDDLPPSKVRQISRGLEPGWQHLMLAPNIAGPRLIHTRPAAAKPLIHVETPRFSDGELFLKQMPNLTARMRDVTASVLGVIISPLLAFLSMTVPLTSEGPCSSRGRASAVGRTSSASTFRTSRTGRCSTTSRRPLKQRLLPTRPHTSHRRKNNHPIVGVFHR